MEISPTCVSSYRKPRSYWYNQVFSLVLTPFPKLPDQLNGENVPGMTQLLGYFAHRGLRYNPRVLRRNVLSHFFPDIRSLAHAVPFGTRGATTFKWKPYLSASFR